MSLFRRAVDEAPCPTCLDFRRVRKEQVIEGAVILDDGTPLPVIRVISAGLIPRSRRIF